MLIQDFFSSCEKKYNLKLDVKSVHVQRMKEDILEDVIAGILCFNGWRETLPRFWRKSLTLLSGWGLAKETHGNNNLHVFTASL